MKELLEAFVLALNISLIFAAVVVLTLVKDELYLVLVALMAIAEALALTVYTMLRQHE